MTTELDQLEGMAAMADGQATEAGIATGGVAIATEPEGPNYAMESAKAVDMFGALVCGYAPAAGAVWTPEKKALMAGALAPCLEKWGVTMETLPPELILAIIAGPVLWQSARCIAEERAKSQPVVETPVADKQTVMDPEEKPEGAVHAQMGLYVDAAGKKKK